MVAPKLDPEREHRIDYEAIVDCYDQYERALGWYYYLKDKCTFPFTAVYTSRRSKKKKPIEITDMLSEEECESSIYVYGRFEDDELPISLVDIEPIANTDEATKEAIADWHYWLQQGYQF